MRFKTLCSKSGTIAHMSENNSTERKETGKIGLFGTKVANVLQNLGATPCFCKAQYVNVSLQCDSKNMYNKRSGLYNGLR